jgi:hypothetical protein
MLPRPAGTLHMECNVLAWQDMAWKGKGWHGNSSQRMEMQGKVRIDLARQGMTRHGKARSRYGKEMQCVTRHDNTRSRYRSSSRYDNARKGCPSNAKERQG